MNTSSGLPSLDTMLNRTEALPEDAFKAFDFTWSVRGLNREDQVIELIDMLQKGFNTNRHVAEILLKINSTLDMLAREGLLFPSGLSAIQDRIYKLQNSPTTASREVKEDQLKDLLTKVVQLQISLAKPEPVETVLENDQEEVDSPQEVQEVPDAPEQSEEPVDTEVVAQEKVPYVDTSTLAQKLGNAMIANIDNKEYFEALLKLSFVEAKGNVFKYAESLVKSVEEAETLPFDKPFLFYILQKFPKIASSLKWDQKLLLIKHIDERIEKMGDSNPHFTTTVYTRLKAMLN